MAPTIREEYDLQRETPDVETSSSSYASRFQGAVGEWFLRIQSEATLDMLRDLPGASILDVGGGHGQLASDLLAQGFSVTVLGSSVACRERLEAYQDHPRFTFATGNLLSLPYPDDAFDVVISFRLLPHLLAWRRGLVELARVARNMVIVDYPTLFSINAIAPVLFRWKRYLEGNTRPFTLFRDAQIIQLFQAFGFRPGARYPEFLFPMVLHRCLARPKLSATLENLARRSGLTRWFGSPVILQVLRQGKVIE